MRESWKPHLYVAAPCAAILATAAWGFTRKACYPYADATGEQVCPGDRNQLQTISEMVARTSYTAELSIVGMRAALRTIISKRQGIGPEDAEIANTAFAIGAAGLIGLTVWSMRVSGDIHNGFTVQTLSMLLVISYIVKEEGTLGQLLFAGEVAALAAYAVLYMTAHRPPPDPVEYFKFKYHYHAVAQITFLVLYHGLIWRAYRKAMKGSDEKATESGALAGHMGNPQDSMNRHGYSQLHWT